MHKDATGRDITRGAFVAYAVASGSGGAIKFGAVVKLKDETVEHNVYDYQTKTHSKQSHTKYTISVVGAQELIQYDHATNARTSKWSLQGKKDGKFARAIHIERLDRVILLEPHQMHQEAKELLDKEIAERGI